MEGAAILTMRHSGPEPEYKPGLGFVDWNVGRAWLLVLFLTSSIRFPPLQEGPLSEKGIKKPAGKDGF